MEITKENLAKRIVPEYSVAAELLGVDPQGVEVALREVSRDLDNIGICLLKNGWCVDSTGMISGLVASELSSLEEAIILAEEYRPGKVKTFFKKYDL